MQIKATKINLENMVQIY